LKRPIP